MKSVSIRILIREKWKQISILGHRNFSCPFLRVNWKRFFFFISTDQDDPDQDELDSEEEYMFSMQQPNPNIDTMRVEEIPAKEPVFNAVPKKSALKKKPSSNPGTPTQDTMNRPLIVRQDNNSTLK